MATANANAAPGATRPVDQHVEFVVKVSAWSFPGVPSARRAEWALLSSPKLVFLFLQTRLVPEDVSTTIGVRMSVAGVLPRVGGAPASC